MTRPTGILGLARPTFDVPFAEENFAAMLAALDAAGVALAGPRALLFDAAAARAAIDELRSAGIGHVLILQVTFTDASMTAEIAMEFSQPLSIWAIPEPRTGGRLRLNSFCGLNLASHALGLRKREFSWLYSAPGAPGIGNAIGDLLLLRRKVNPLTAGKPMPVPAVASAAARRLQGLRIGRIGEHPAGFDTCAYDPVALEAIAGISVETITLGELFDRARAVGEADVSATRQIASEAMSGLEAVDQRQLDRSLRLKNALDELKAEKHLDAFAIRCWPEMFTDYSGAVCGPVSMLGERRTPCACEADVYGALTAFLLQEIAGQAVFLADLVDIDTNDDSAVVWHCGQAPVSMRDPDCTAEATIHTNRRMPLLFQFPLKPGQVTFARISQAQGRPRMVIAGGQMLKRPMAYTGTSGVVRFDTPAFDVLGRIIDCGLEHHMALAYGDHRDALHAAAATLGLPVTELT